MTKPQPKKIASEPEVVIVGTEIGNQREADAIVLPDAEIQSEEITAIEHHIESLPEAYILRKYLGRNYSPPKLPFPPPVYPSSWYAANGIPTCTACGEKYRTDRYGLPLCPVDAVDCPRQA